MKLALSARGPALSSELDPRFGRASYFVAVDTDTGKLSIVTSAVGVMVVPAFGGFWIDRLLGTKYVFAILGVIFGIVWGMHCLLEMVMARPPIQVLLTLSKMIGESKG